MGDSDLEPIGLAEIIGVVERLPDTSHQSSGQHTALLVRKKKFGYHLVDHHGDGGSHSSAKRPRGTTMHCSPKTPSDSSCLPT